LKNLPSSNALRESSQPDDRLRRRVVIVFFAGLLLMAALAVAIGWVVERLNGWGVFELGWLNPLLGVVMTLGGTALVVWSVRVQYILGGGTPAPKVATQNLVTQGPYAYIRNPMTLGAFFIYLGIGVWTGSGLVILLTITIFSLLLAYIYVHETNELSERFGEPYLEYKKRTPFLVPRLWPRR
jgi:protein-S-isoprenylcysteine O-methyltransferase Ste14